MGRSQHIGVLAGEKSGDILGGAVLRELKCRNSDVSFSGIGGEQMAHHGLVSLHDMERLSVFGLVEPLKRLPELLSIRRSVWQHMMKHQPQPQLFLGIDSPDFNLALEQKLRHTGIKTAHLVSPSVWAWRPGRIHKIKKAVDLMLCLLPFERDFYEQHGVRAALVGHPLIEELAVLPDQETARKYLGLPQQGHVLVCMPGSRASEVEQLGPIFAQVVMKLLASDSELKVIVPAASFERLEQIKYFMPIEDDRFSIIEGQSRLAMVASDSILCASGTTTLEAMLIGRPITIAYRMAWLSWQILSRMVTSQFVGLPNIIAGERVVPEFLQGKATVDNLYQSVLESFGTAGDTQRLRFAELSTSMGSDFAVRSVDAIEELLADHAD
ncbi:MAG: lipid-A-disaccharide synthase [Pseudomonadota bacterium]|nr:lipid-A-disaccharide synthase [Pseudomonadota bacterium]